MNIIEKLKEDLSKFDISFTDVEANKDNPYKVKITLPWKDYLNEYNALFCAVMHTAIEFNCYVAQNKVSLDSDNKTYAIISIEFQEPLKSIDYMDDNQI